MADRVHPVTVAEDGLEALAVRIGRMRYDALAVFLKALSANLSDQAEGDRGRGRVRLASLLDDASRQTGNAFQCIEKAWRLSKPYMADELAQTPEITQREDDMSELPGYHGESLCIMNEMADVEAARRLAALLDDASVRTRYGQDECLLEDASDAMKTLANRLEEERAKSGGAAAPLKTE